MKRKLKTPGTDAAIINLKSHLMEEKPKSQIQLLHDANGKIYDLIEELYELHIPLGLAFQKLRETTTEIQSAITKLIDQNVNKPIPASKHPQEDGNQNLDVKPNKQPEIIVEYDTRKK